ncbi:MAG: M55 family metallopeptidase [Opitutaceae bacterium]|jgi:D-amino peptidase|nr:M55 family metallopeptidase [Opitutaceae bacterium]
MIPNVYIMADAEGISGIYESRQVMDGESRYADCRVNMAKDINACVKACKEAGAQKVFVRDAHSAGSNVTWANLSSLADWYIIGDSRNNRFPGLDECDAIILLGYHAMAGTPQAILEHTMSSKEVQNYWLNGRKTGEIGIDAAIAGDHDKPVIMVSGDDKTCAEAKDFLPWVTTAEVKKGLSINGGMLLPPDKAYALLAAKTKESMANIALAKPFIPAKPVTLRVELTERSRLSIPEASPCMKIIDGRTYEVRCATTEEALRHL